MLANYGITLYLYSYSDKAADQNSARAADLAYEQRLLAENRSALLSSLNKEVPGLDLRHAALVLFISFTFFIYIIHTGDKCKFWRGVTTGGFCTSGISTSGK
jgi:hypothetical protein